MHVVARTVVAQVEPEHVVTGAHKLSGRHEIVRGVAAPFPPMQEDHDAVHSWASRSGEVRQQSHAALLFACLVAPGVDKYRNAPAHQVVRHIQRVVVSTVCRTPLRKGRIGSKGLSGVRSTSSNWFMDNALGQDRGQAGLADCLAPRGRLHAAGSVTIAAVRPTERRGPAGTDSDWRTVHRSRSNMPKQFPPPLRRRCISLLPRL